MLTKATVQTAFNAIRATLPKVSVRLPSGRAVDCTRFPLSSDYVGDIGGTDPQVNGGLRFNVSEIEPERISEGTKIEVRDERGDWIPYRAVSTRYDELEATVLVLYGDTTE
jgi:hypothetical protein